jgi:gas vesicle protein
MLNITGTRRASLGGFEVEASNMGTTALVGIGLLFATLGVALGAVLGRYVWPAGRVKDTAALVEGQLEIARLTERLQSLTTQVQEEVERTRSLEAQRAAASDEAKTAVAQVARLTEREVGLNVKIAEQAQQLVDLQKQLTTEFENIANRILKASASELSEGSQKALALILDPLRERIQEFQKKVETTYDAETRDVLSLKEQIKLIMETSHAIGSQADGLAKALRGDSQLRGRWGELALERILESAGLTEGREYITQGRGLGLKSEGGGVQRPDVVVMLPEQRTMIIDSKLPLTGYERLIAAGDEVERNTASDQFIRDVKTHIDELAGKRYQAALAPIRLTRIGNLRAVNALPNAAALTFSPALTVIYGGNGTGKSGFARLLSTVCFSRVQYRILPNVYEDGAGQVPAAEITVLDGSQVARSIPLQEAKGDPDLKRIAVFDTSVARTHLAACRTGVFGAGWPRRGRFWRTTTSFAVRSAPVRG